jgi:hypothetical protein
MGFARACGLSFLGMPRRRQAAAAATELGQPPTLLAMACVALGVGASWVLSALDRAARATTGTDIHAVLRPADPIGQRQPISALRRRRDRLLIYAY